VAGLRRRSVDIVAAADVGLLGAADEAHIERATELARVVVSNDQDFLRMATTDRRAAPVTPD
jgi:predicted nuclease of predicted toxin-antitoxin system